MIRVHRGQEPSTLAARRDAEIERVAHALEQGIPLSNDLIGDMYRVAKDRLCEDQAGKCAYCEKPLYEPPYNPVEHFRPKASARQGDVFMAGYWWLSWTWQNLLFACPICNSSYKRDWFPLADGSVRLAARALPPGQERPLLIDPGGEDPMDHIQFRPHDDSNGRRTWRPVPRNGSKRGEETIEKIGLDRDDLLGAYTQHVNDHVLPVVEELRQFEQRPARFAGRWNRSVLPLVQRGRPFAALTWDAFDHDYSEPRREELAVALPRPWPG